MKKTHPFFIITNMNIIEKILFPKLDWIQIEVSGLCNALCFYCPHTVFRKFWRGRNLEIQEFQKIKPYFKKVRLLYLQGWGEPFLNPRFFDFVKIAKAEGVMVGTTTNGTVIENYHIEKIIESELDIIAFSLTGITTNDQLRRGTSIDRVFRIIDELSKRKLKLGSLTPKIHIAYMLLASNFHELDHIVESFQDRGIDCVVISFLDFLPNPSFKQESLAPKNEEDYLKIKELLNSIALVGKSRGLTVVFNLPHPERKNRSCSERPLSSIFINSLGYVSPCVYTGIPADGVMNLSFGNIKQRNLWSIWKDINYKRFRFTHRERKFSKPCVDCNKLRIF